MFLSDKSCFFVCLRLNFTVFKFGNKKNVQLCDEG